jgi:hypothetical protein
MNNKASGGAGQVAVDRGPADPKGLGNGGHGVLPRRIHLLGHLELVAGQRRRSAAVAAAGPGRGQPRGRAFADEVAFEFGQGREHVEDELAARGGGVDRLLEAAEPDPAVGQAGDGVDQVAERLAEAVEFPDDEGVARAQLVQDLLKGGSVGAGAAGGLGEHPVATGALQRVDVELRLLVGGGDAGIASRCPMPVTVAEPCDNAGSATLISDTGIGRIQGP